MKIVMIRNWFWKGGLLREGDKYNLTNAEAATLIDLGHAKPLADATPATPEVATVAPTERAVAPKATRKPNATTSKKRNANRRR